MHDQKVSKIHVPALITRWMTAIKAELTSRQDDKASLIMCFIYSTVSAEIRLFVCFCFCFRKLPLIVQFAFDLRQFKWGFASFSVKVTALKVSLF